MDLKVRDRTPEELSVRKNEFLKICDTLDNLNINYFLQTGILLGAIRDKEIYNSSNFKNKRITFLRDMKNKIKKKIYLILKGVKL